MRTPTLLAMLAVTLALAGCGGDDTTEGSGGPASGGGSGETISMARATWDTGWFQAEVYRQLLTELGYEVGDPANDTRDANGFYPALADGEYDLWANGWFPLHEPYQTGELFTGASFEADVTPVGEQVADGARQGYLVDRASAEELGLTSMSDLADPEVAAAFDRDGNGKADLVGCNEGWGCNLTITEHIAELDWGGNVEQVVGNYPDLFEERVLGALESGDPVLFYTWTPNWTVAEAVPGEDVVWLPSPALEGVEDTAVDLDGCAGDQSPCDLGWAVNTIQAVANTEFLEGHPDVAALLEQVTIPLEDIAAQNAEMYEAEEYTASDLEAAAQAWIQDNRELVDEWLAAARNA